MFYSSCGLWLCVDALLAGEQLFHEALLLLFQPFQLLLQVGDLGVGGGEEGSDFVLFGFFGQGDFSVQEFVGGDAAGFAAADGASVEGAVELFPCYIAQEIFGDDFVREVEARKVEGGFVAVEVLRDDAEGAVEEIELAVDELAGAADVVFCVYASKLFLFFFHDALSVKLHGDLLGGAAIGAWDTALFDQLAYSRGLPRLVCRLCKTFTPA